MVSLVPWMCRILTGCRKKIQRAAQFTLRADGSGNVRWQRRAALGALSLFIHRAFWSERIGHRFLLRKNQ
jgi:hypothetical protein